MKVQPFWIDAAWLAAMALYALAGMMLASFHGDEAMQISMSRDFQTAFIDHQPARLMVSPPYEMDDDPWLRLLNGSFNRYAIGLSWHLAGLDAGMLPPRPGWDWGMDYNRAVEAGYRPPRALLRAARIPSALLLAISAGVMFGIGRQLGGRPLAYIASALYILNPIVLLNGRRAMMEGSLLCFGLLTLLLAILVSRGRSDWRWWAALTLCAGLTLASKHTGIVFVAGAFGWIGVSHVLARDASAEAPKSDVVIVLFKILDSAVLSMLIFIALSPALWNNPVARLRDLIDQRRQLIDFQLATGPGAQTSLLNRVGDIITQPFMTPVAHFESDYWATIEPITAEINRYMGSTLSGLHFSWPLGLPLTLLAGWGIVIILRQWRSWRVGLFVWFAITATSLLVSPLRWQRYSLPLIPPATLFVGIGLMSIIHRTRQRTETNIPASVSASA